MKSLSISTSKENKLQVEDSGDLESQMERAEYSSITILSTYICELCARIKSETQSNRAQIIKLCLLRLIRGMTSTASVLLTPTSSPAIFEFLNEAMVVPRDSCGLQAANWWRAFYLLPGKEHLPSEDLDVFMELGLNALKKLFTCCLIMTQEELKQVLKGESKEKLIEEEDCNCPQLFDDDETSPESEIRNLLDNKVDPVFFREIALEAAESYFLLKSAFSSS